MKKIKNHYPQGYLLGYQVYAMLFVCQAEALTGTIYFWCLVMLFGSITHTQIGNEED
ncbi:hypothetical protein L873DRAFT_1802016 [Choiromyces venosus 120613-1]|uniref:Uncharacterized protein n=1 Tax=Choiromyces venosus 120613-1 TaxID=1336337 RepID=A0A3N4JW29_9PEZI|nr:hypothetical protein L873DRAFT_1802016 [Choiromyces venosus 120613-1]